MSAVLQPARNAGEWFTASELVGLAGLPVHVQRVRELALREGWKARTRIGRGGGVEYAGASLPAPVRAALAQRALSAEPLLPAVRQRAVIAQATAANGALAGTAAVANVTGRRADVRDARLQVLLAFRRLHEQLGGPLQPSLEAFMQLWHAGRAVPDEVRRNVTRLSCATLRRWHLGLQLHGAAAVTPRGNPRRGGSAVLDGDVGRAVLALLTDKPHLGAAHLYRILRMQFERLPSERSFRRALAQWKAANSQLFTALTNPDAWKNRYMSAAGNASERIRAVNQLWEMDSTPGDLILADRARHAVIGVIDVFSRRMRLLVSRTSRSGAIMSLVRSSIRAWGKPGAIKTDNGADYTARQLELALLGLDIEHPLCAPFSPEQKPHIERGLGTSLHDVFELLDGFVGHNVAERKAIESRRSFAQRLMQGETVELRLTAEQLQAELDRWCDRYNSREHSSLGCSPDERAASSRGALLQIDDRALDMLLAPSSDGGIRTLTKKGLKIDHGWFNAAALGGLEGRQFQCKVDDADIGRCYVFDLDGSFVCEALDYERLGISAAEVANERRARQAKVIREQKRELRALTREVDTRGLVQAVLRSRTDAAVAASPNVLALPKLRIEHVGPVIESIKRAAPQPIDEAALAAAEARVQARLAAPAPIKTIDTPELRYARWSRLQARVQRGEALGADERSWFEVYGQGAEWRAMKQMFEAFGLDADGVLREAGQ
jgi:hypothetical protein